MFRLTSLKGLACIAEGDQLGEGQGQLHYRQEADTPCTVCGAGTGNWTEHGVWHARSKRKCGGAQA